MSNIEKQGCANSIVFVFSRQHPLYDVAPASGFRPRIVSCPPLYCQRYNQHRYQQFGIVKIRKKAEFTYYIGVTHQCFHTTNFGQIDNIDGCPYGAHHSHQELHKICQNNSFETTHCGVQYGDNTGQQQGAGGFHIEHDTANFDDGQTDGGHNQHIEQHAQINSPEAS